nr:MAG TPA: Repressor protein CI [Caudoviricetes sp.]
MNMTTGERMKQRRKEIGFSAEKVAERLGVSPATIYRYEKGDIEKVPVDSLAELAKILQTTPAYLMGWEEQPTPKPTSPAPIPPGFEPMPEMDWVPLVGRIACGTPITAEENVERIVCVPSKWHSTFTLTCKGDSMEPRIHDGDLVAIRSQPEVENGEIAAVRIDGEATLKHVYLHDSFIELRPENPAFNSIILSREDMNNVVIEGKAVGLCRDI